MANLWTYSDWISQTDQTVRLTRLRLHIEEVSQHVVGNKQRSGAAKFPVDPDYYQSLRAQETQLAAIVEPTGVGKLNAPIARLRARFRRS